MEISPHRPTPGEVQIDLRMVFQSTDVDEGDACWGSRDFMDQAMRVLGNRDLPNRRNRLKVPVRETIDAPRTKPGAAG